MANLAIKGHETRGREVIELLEMLGGKNIYNLTGTKEIWYILSGNTIKHSEYLFEKGFSLEEFLEKYPYKVGDKVKAARINDFIGRITNVRWDDNEEQIIYTVEWDDATKSTLTYFAKGLQPYKEETMEKRENFAIFNIEHKQLKVHSLKFDKTQLVINDEYELNQEGDTYYIVRKKPQYPKTFIEVLNFWHPDRHLEDDYQRCYKKYLIEKFQDLLYARDAYWKIAGEQMGLGKPWKPDWTDNSDKYFICYLKNEVWMSNIRDCNRLLVFPTEEMRDIFYKNFKDLIEQCKELL